MLVNKNTDKSIVLSACFQITAIWLYKFKKQTLLHFVHTNTRTHTTSTHFDAKNGYNLNYTEYVAHHLCVIARNFCYILVWDII